MMRSTWRRFWDHFWRMRVTLGSLWGQFGVTFGVWGSLWTTLGSLWKLFGVTCPPKRAHKQEIHIFPTYFAFPRGHEDAGPSFQPSEPSPPGVILKWFWGQFGYLWVTLYHLMVTLHWRWSHFRYIKVHFQKTFISPTDFNDFIRLWVQHDVAFGITFGVWG